MLALMTTNFITFEFARIYLYYQSKGLAYSYDGSQIIYLSTLPFFINLYVPKCKVFPWDIRDKK